MAEEATATEIKEPQKHPEEVRIGQNFKLFDPKSVISDGDDMPPRSTVRLRLGDSAEIPPIDFDVNLFFAAGSQLAGIHPFDPDRGYQISGEDLNLGEREKKVLGSLDVENNLLLRLPPDFRLEIMNSHHTEGSPGHKMPDNLRLRLVFPQGSFESKAEPNESRFRTWYPRHLGELPSREFIPKVQSKVPFGHALLLPNDIKKLLQISAQFVLASE